MAVPKEKVIAILKEKLKGKGHSNTYFDSLATRHAAKIPTEDDIDEYIEERIDDWMDAATEADRRATSAVTKAKREAANTIIGEQKEETDKTPAPQVPTDTPDWAKPLFKGLETLAGVVTSMQSEKSQNTIKERFLADPRLKGIDPVLLEGRIPAKEEEFDAVVEKAAEALKAYAKPDGQQQQQQQQTRQSDRPRVTNPGGGKGNGDGKSAVATKEELDAVMPKFRI